MTIGTGARVLGERLPEPGPRARRALLGLLVLAADYGAMEVSDWWTPVGRAAPLLWLPAGVGFAVVLLGGPLYALPVTLAALAEGLVERGQHPAAAVVAAAGAGAAALVGALPRLAGVELAEEAGAVVARVAAAVLSTCIAAASLLGSVELARSGPLAAGTYFGETAAAALAGILVVSPLLRTWLQPALPAPAGLFERAAMVVAAAGLAGLAGSDVISPAGPTAYLAFPIVLWGALRTGRRWTALAVAATAFASTTNLTYGKGPYAVLGPNGGVALDGFLCAVAVTGTLVAALVYTQWSAQRDLRRSERRFRTLLERATDVVTVIDREGRVLYQSPALGYSEEELPGTDAFSLIHPDDVAGARRLFAQLLAAPERQVEAAVRYRHRDGHWVPLVSTARNLLEDRAVGGILVNSRDVTEQRQAEERYRRLVEELPLVTYVRGPEQGDPPVYVSPQFEDLFGYPVAAWFEDPELPRKLTHPDDLAELDELFVEQGPDSRRAEYRVVARDGGVVWVLDHMVTLRDESGRPVAVQGFLVDVGERRRLEAQLRTAQRMEALGLLAGGVAHDFNNLLTAISGYVELARAHLREPARARADLDEVARAAERAGELTRQLLAFGRRAPVEPEVVDLNAAVREARPLLERLAGGGVRLELDLSRDAGSVRVDGSQFGQVLVNLVVNARDALPGAGRVTIATGREPGEDFAFVSVADTGVGIEPEVLERLFEPFFTTKSVGEGTGLGLAVVHGIVRQAGGRVVVRSEPGAGAEFRVVLPRSEGPPPTPEVESHAPPRGSETVLLVEDEDVVRRLIEEMLERQGYRVIAAGSPAEALAVDEPYELLLTDIVMPGMSGTDLARRLSDRRPQTAVLFTSGYSGADDEGVLAGRLLQKPFTLEQLASGVRAALDARRRPPS